MADYSFKTLEMIMADNLVPSKYAGKDIRLLYSKENPAHMGWWFAKGDGHERVSLYFLVKELGMSAEELHSLPDGYMVE